jgi:hypothetical protein
MGFWESLNPLDWSVGGHNVGGAILGTQLGGIQGGFLGDLLQTATTRRDRPSLSEESSGGSSEASPYGGGSEQSLQHYKGPTSVPMSPYQQNLLSLVNNLVTGQYGQYNQMLSGKPDNGLLDLAVLNPMRQDLKEQVLPSLRDTYSGGVYGENYNTGARQAAEERATYDTFKNINTTRFQAAENAKAQSLQAMGLLPSMMGIEDVERQNAIQNLERTINVHYKNQGLTEQDIQNDLAFADLALRGELGQGQLALGQQQVDLQREQYNMQVDAQNQANNAGLWGGIGSLLGGGLGLATGNPLGMMLGSQLGSSAGLFAGGANTAGYQTLNQGIGNYGMYNLMQSYMQPPRQSYMPAGYGNYSVLGDINTPMNSSLTDYTPYSSRLTSSLTDYYASPSGF